MDGPVPVTLVTGWKGSTLRRLTEGLVAALAPLEVAVVGGRDQGGSSAALFCETEPEISERSKGCACCALRSDLARIVARLVGRRRRPDWILVEADAWADPVLAAQTFLTDPRLAMSTRIDGIVAVVDGPAASARILSGLAAWPGEVSSDQIAIADRIAVSGGGGLTAPALQAIQHAAARANERAVVVADLDEVSAQRRLVHLEAFGPEGVVLIEGRLTRAGRPRGPAGGGSAAFFVETSGWLDQSRLDRWIGDLHRSNEHRLLRIEGVLAIRGRNRQFVFQGLGNVLHQWRGRRFAPGEARTSRLAIAGRNLDAGALQDSLTDCVAR